MNHASWRLVDDSLLTPRWHIMSGMALHAFKYMSLFGLCGGCRWLRRRVAIDAASQVHFSIFEMMKNCHSILIVDEEQSGPLIRIWGEVKIRDFQKSSYFSYPFSFSQKLSLSQSLPSMKFFIFFCNLLHKYNSLFICLFSFSFFAFPFRATCKVLWFLEFLTPGIVGTLPLLESWPCLLRWITCWRCSRRLARLHVSHQAPHRRRLMWKLYQFPLSCWWRRIIILTMSAGTICRKIQTRFWLQKRSRYGQRSLTSLPGWKFVLLTR